MECLLTCREKNAIIILWIYEIQEVFVLEKIKKKLLAFAVLAMAIALSFSAAPTQAFSGTQVYAAAQYDSEQLEEYALQVAIIVNRERAALGLSPLKFSDKLSEVANLRARETETAFSHTRPNETSCFTAIDEAGIYYYYAGENIAYGQKTPQAVMTAWMNSTGHRENILSTYPEYLGVGVTYTNGRYYWVQLFALSDDLDGTVPVDPEKAAKITTHPKDFIGKSGAAASFTVKASGDGLSYQWQLSDDKGKTWRNSSVKTANYSTKLTSVNNGRYVRCLVTDSYGNTLASNAASMKISVVSITTGPLDCITKIGSPVKFNVAASGEGLSYQWQLSDDGQNWRNSSVKTAAYATTLTTVNNGRQVRCVITDKYGTAATSRTAVMRTDGVQITTQPTNCVTDIGSQVKFTVKAVGDSLSYQWLLSDDAGKNWRSSSVKTATYSTTLSAVNNGRYVCCIVTDKYGSRAISNSVVMKTPALQITAQPTNVKTSIGSQVKFTVKASGSGLSYQWQLSDDEGKTWRNSSVKTATYYTTLSTVNDGRYVRCIITDKNGGKVTSKSAYMKSK